MSEEVCGEQCVRVEGAEQEKESERLRVVTQIIVSSCRSPAFRQYERQ